MQFNTTEVHINYKVPRYGQGNLVKYSFRGGEENPKQKACTL